MRSKSDISHSNISIIVPTLNEDGNVAEFSKRVDQALRPSGLTYELIFIDDHSTDNTIGRLNELKERYPIRAFRKKGERGKAYSLLEGLAVANYETVCMIDADLQYPPEAIVPMLKKMQQTGAKLVTTKRQAYEAGAVRRLTTTAFNFIFCQLLFGVKEDTQSGLKLCDARVINEFTLSPSPWSFDLELVVRMRQANHKVAVYPIRFSEREQGDSKAKILGLSYELAKSSLRLKAQMMFRKSAFALDQKGV